MVSKGLLVKVDARPAKSAEVEGFLRGTLETVRQEPGTTAWFAIHFGGSTFGIFDAFPDDAAREKHLAGAVPKILTGEVGVLFEAPPTIERVDVLAFKLPAAPSVNGVTKGVLLTLPPKDGRHADLEKLLRDAQPLVEAEPKTRAWFALRRENGDCAIFDVFEDNSGRLAHLAGAVPRELAKHVSLLGGMPDPDLLDIVADKIGG